MWLVKKWREHRAVRSFVNDELSHWDADGNLYRSDVTHFGRVFVSERESLDEREQALKSMSHAAVAGGPEAVAASHAFLPHMFALMKQDSPQYAPIKLQVLRSLSEICYRNRVAQDMVIQDAELPKILCETIGEVTHIIECRWACYVLNIIMADNIPVIDALNEVPDLREALGQASDFPRSWEIWGCNIPMRCLKLLTIRLKTTQ